MRKATETADLIDSDMNNRVAYFYFYFFALRVLQHAS